MAFLLKDGSIFLHIPKTGGTWVEKVLQENNLLQKPLFRNKTNYRMSYSAHIDLSITISFLNSPIMKLRYPLHKKATDPFIFVFIRNPIDWYQSYFKYLFKVKFKEYSNSIYSLHPMASLNNCYSKNFNTFVENILKKEPGYLTNLYARYIHSDKVSYIGKQENLAKDLIEALKKTNLVFDERKILEFPAINKSEEQEIKWSQKNYDAILKHERLIFTRFNYDM